MMGCHRFEDSTHQRAGFERFIVGHGDVMRPIDLGRQAEVGTVLPHLLVTEHAQCSRQVGPTNIARNLHTAKTSSRTKCSRITLGIVPGTPSPK